MREYETVKLIKENHPAAKGYILQSPGGASFVLKTTDKEPDGRYCLLGILEG